MSGQSFFLFDIINFVVPEPCIFFWIPASIEETGPIIHSRAKIFLAKGTATSIW